MTAEQWRFIPGYGDAYQASSFGQVRSLPRNVWYGTHWKRLRGKMLTARQNHDGYLRVRIGGRNVFVHVLVLIAFIGPKPDGMHCCHRDGNAGNSALENLRWGTPSSNVQDRRIHGTYQDGQRNPMSNAWIKRRASVVDCS